MLSEILMVNIFQNVDSGGSEIICLLIENIFQNVDSGGFCKLDKPMSTH